MTDVNDVRPGLQIRTRTVRRTPLGMIVAPEYLDARRSNATATILNYVPGHGGDVWFARHDDGAVAAYSYVEFDAAEDIGG